MRTDAPKPKPTQVLVLSEIAGLLDALRDVVPPDEAEFFRHTPATVTTQTLMCFEVLIADPPSFAHAVDRCAKGALRWAQSAFPGVDRLVSRTVKNREYVLTRLGGVFGDAMAEYCVVHALAVERGLRRDYENQRMATLGPRATLARNYRTAHELVVGVLGFGENGRRIGEVFAFLGAKVWAVRRRHGAGSEGGAMWETPPDALPDFVERCFGLGDDSDVFFSGCDVVVNALPSTPRTVGILDENALRAFKRGSILINVGRWDVFGASPEEAEKNLFSALDSEDSKIARVVLDVGSAEPLPKTSSLWSHPKIIATTCGVAAATPTDIACVFLENLRLYRNGKRLKREVDWDQGY